jgi:hypothetical protein
MDEQPPKKSPAWIFGEAMYKALEKKIQIERNPSDRQKL